LKGVPLRIAIGPKDLEHERVEIARRDILTKSSVSQVEIVNYVEEQLQEMQQALFDKAKRFREENITKVETFAEFQSVIKEKGGFISAHWDGTQESEEAIKKTTKATIRCIPLDAKEEVGSCVYSGKPSKMRVLFAKAY
jgi:prolyl-tRNA synthetase